MKNKIFITILLIAGLVPAIAQNYHPDTIDYPFEKYYCYFDRNRWLDGDTFVRCNVATMGPDVYDSIRDIYIQTFKWDTATLHVHHEARVFRTQHIINTVPEWVYYNYTPRPIKVLGIAANSKTEHPYWQPSSNPPDSTEYLLFYDARPDTFVCRQRKIWDASDSIRLMRLHNRGSSSYYDGGCCRNSMEYNLTEPFRETYFERPILVKDSFYLGGTSYSYDAYYGRFNLNDNSATILIYYADQGGNGGFHYDPRNPCSIPVDTCPAIPSGRIKIRYPRQPYSFEANDKFIPYQWMDRTIFETTPYVYPIFEEMCPVVSGLRVEDRQGDEVTVTWNAHGSHTTWMVTYGPMGMPRDSFAVVACLQPSLTITGLDSTMIYDISVQAQCDYHVSDLEPLDADVLNNRDTTFFGEQGKHLYLRGGNLVAINDVTPDDGILLRPNPADRQVTVSAPLPLRRVEVYDMAGRLMEAHQPNGTALQIDLKTYPTGTYLVKVTTANGTSTKKLVVK